MSKVQRLRTKDDAPTLWWWLGLPVRLAQAWWEVTWPRLSGRPLSPHDEEMTWRFVWLTDEQADWLIAEAQKMLEREQRAAPTKEVDGAEHKLK